ncbi:hypothetical protein M427DRAFT_74973, partial [Gonapodya prolifera JEL478]
MDSPPRTVSIRHSLASPSPANMSAQHKGSFRLSPIEGIPTRAFRCPACGRTFTRKDVMLRHQKRVTCKLNRLVGLDPQPPEKAPRRASKPPRGRPRNEDMVEHIDVPMSAHPQQSTSPSHSSPPNSPSPLSPSSMPARPFLPRSVSMDHRSLPLPAHPAPYIPARRESVPLPALSPSTIDGTMRQFAQEFEERTWPSHQATNYEPSTSQLVTIPPRGIPGSQQDHTWPPVANYHSSTSSSLQLVTIPLPPRGVPGSQRWASRSPPGGQYSPFSPAFLEPFPVS